MREAHRRWHDCLDGYQSPEDFQDALNSAIQALRNVTFVLQAAKSSVPGFDAWYADEQAKMRSDPVLRWLVDARNTVVKRGDLETHSRLTIKIIADYGDEARDVDLEQRTWDELREAGPDDLTQTITDAPVGTKTSDLFQLVDEIGMPLAVRSDASVVFERRWVARDMPRYELLALLAHAYGRLRDLVSRCHGLLNKDTVRLVSAKSPDGEEIYLTETLSELPLGGRLPCMVSSSDRRSTRYRLIDGQEVEFVMTELKLDPSVDVSQLTKKYGARPEPPPKPLGMMQSVDELKPLVQWYAKTAEGILRSGEDHGWFSHFYRRGRRVGTRYHAASDAQGKAAIAGEVARLALRNEYDVVVMLGEVWYSPLDRTPDGAYIAPERHQSRQEAMMIDALAMSGVEITALIPFTTIGGEPPNRRVELSPVEFDSAPGLGLLEPTRRAWGVKLAGRHRGASFFKH